MKKHQFFGAFFRLEKPIRLAVYGQTLRPLRSKGVVSTPIYRFASLILQWSQSSTPQDAAMSYAILRTAKLKTVGNIIGSLSHNYRTRETPNSNPSLVSKNLHVLTTQREAAEAIRKRIPVKHRKDAVLCIEYMITASPEFFAEGGDSKAYFETAYAWLQAKHGAENVITATIHMDETTPHMAAYVVPLDESGKLNAKKFLGGRDKLSQMQTDFANHVAEFGLDRGVKGSKAKHTSIKEYYSRLNAELAEELDMGLSVKPPEQGETHETFARRVITKFREKVNGDYQTMKMQLEEKGRESEQILQQHKQAISLIEEYEELLQPIHSLKPANKAKLKAEMVSSVTEARTKLLQEEKQRLMATMSPVERVEFEYKEATNSPEFQKLGSLDRLAAMREWKIKIAEAKKLDENAAPVKNDYDSPSPF